MSSAVVAVVPVGPGERETVRAARVVRSLADHEPDLAELVVVVDGTTEAALASHLRPGHWPVTYLTNPRDGRGNGILDGLACGLTAAYAHIARRRPGAHAWKIDTDALVLRPSGGQIADFFARRPDVGMVGTYSANPDGSARNTESAWWEKHFKRYLLPLWYWRSTNRLTSAWVGPGRRFARLLREAHAKGLNWGDHVQGGSYALSAAMLARWLAAGRLERPTDWIGAPLGDDICFSHWTVLDDFRLADYNGRGEVFGVKNVGLPMPVDALLAANYGVVHSLKVGDWDAECVVADELARRTASRSTA